MRANLANALLAALALGAAACAPQQGLRGERELRADPSKVVATELAFARTAQERGQWTAFREYSTGDAVMFVPQPVTAHEWLRTQKDPAQAVRWQPHQVWSSCDGTLAATRGPWQRPDGSTGYFTTVWQRQGNRDYKWVMDQGDALAQPLPAREMIEAKVAGCGTTPGAPPTDIVPTGQMFGGQSRDGTLAWDVLSQADGTRVVNVRYWDGAAWVYAIRERVAAAR